MEAKVELITPSVARRYMAHNTNNYRKINMHKVGIYARDMMNGNWQENGEAIKFNNKGELVDGQHRLEAIIKSDCAIKSLVITGVDNSVTIYDSGKNRSMREIALAEGIPARLAEGTFTGAAAIIIMGDPRGYKAGSSKQYPSRKEIMEFLHEHQHLWDNVYYVTRSFKGTEHGNLITRKAVIYAATYYLLALGYDMELMRTFFTIVGNGFPVSGYENTPAIVLRNMLINWSQKNEDRVKYFHATVSAFLDFLNFTPRTKPYTKIDKVTAETLKTIAEKAR